MTEGYEVSGNALDRSVLASLRELQDDGDPDIVAESGIVSVFKGDLSNPKTCVGAYMDERTDKSNSSIVISNTFKIIKVRVAE